jgi:hypothetical protein
MWVRVAPGWSVRHLAALGRRRTSTGKVGFAMPRNRFGPGDPVWDSTHRKWGRFTSDAVEPGGAWVVFDGDADETWVQVAGLVPESDVTGVLR